DWRRRDHFARAVGVHGRDDAGHFHGLDHAGGPVVADLQLALHGGNRGAPAFGHETHRFVIERVFLAALAAFAAALEAAASAFIGAGKDFLDVVGCATLFPGLHHTVHLVV